MVHVEELELPKSVCISIPAYTGTVPVEAAIHLAEAVSKLQNMGVTVVIQTERECGLVDLARNKLAKTFMEKTDCEKLLFIDNDIVFTSDDVLRLLAYSGKHKIIGATYPVRKDLPPTFFVYMDGPPKLDKDGLVPVKALGMGFIVIDRSVFEEMKINTKTYEKDGEQYVCYFKTGVINNKYYGEDIMFLLNWTYKYKGEVMLDPWINLQHVGHKYYDYKFSDWLKETINGNDSN